jgi:hypothetical protein
VDRCGSTFSRLHRSISVILSFGTIMIALVLLVRTPGVRRKWLWAIGCVWGLGLFSIDWSSNLANVSPFYIELFGTIIAKSSVLAGWRVGFGIPLVTIIFILRRRSLGSKPTRTEPSLAQ